MTTIILTADRASKFSEIALGHVEREYPNNLDHELGSPEDAHTPRELHPIFYGSYDWHSCVHSYWMLARLIRRFPDMDQAPRIRALFDKQFEPAKVAVECRYFATSGGRDFKRPYGWAWLLKLAAELQGLEKTEWSEALQPLASTIEKGFREFLPRATYPVRVGTHYNTAFALRMAADYASATNNSGFTTLLEETARRWYGADIDCPAWGEPSGDDFLSPSLIEAECMRRLLPSDEFAIWFAGFFPTLGEAEPRVLFISASVSDRTDGKIAHLDGLNLSRAWCFQSLASALSDNEAVAAVARTAATNHLNISLPHLAEDYMGEHWLASFAVLAIDGV